MSKYPEFYPYGERWPWPVRIAMVIPKLTLVAARLGMIVGYYGGKYAAAKAHNAAFLVIDKILNMKDGG